jgi:hypothetical protein
VKEIKYYPRTWRAVFRTRERQKLLVALASIRQHGNVDGIAGSREQTLALINVACHRRFIIWRGPALRYQLTRRGERFLAKHSEATSSSSHLKFVLATRLALAGFMLAAIGIANSDWVERDKQDSLQTRPASTTAELGSGGVAPARVSTVSPGPETLPASPQVNDRPDRKSATAMSREPASSKASVNRHQRDRIRHVQRKQPAKVEVNPRGLNTQDPAWGILGYGWNPNRLNQDRP